jgi:diadenosine tetraphosphate (Ap4A) HIT family hydrolase
MNERANTCFICDRVALWVNGKNPYFIHEFKHSIFVVGDHQFHRGYSLILLKEHIRELRELPDLTQRDLFVEVMTAGKAVHAAFQPWKLNYACYGNQAEHVHWHIFPRYDTEPDHARNPWVHCDAFMEHKIDDTAARHIAASIRDHLPKNQGTPGLT